MSEKNKTTLQKANAAISEGDVEGFLSFCTDDIEWTAVGEQLSREKRLFGNGWPRRTGSLRSIRSLTRSPRATSLRCSVR